MRRAHEVGVNRFWWVNHSQTWVAEVEHGFIWSPQEEAHGARSQFYDNLLRTSPGEVILSFAAGRIRAVGRIQDYATALRMPEKLKSNITSWRDNGWLVPVRWTPVHGPITRDIIDLIRPLLPKKYSPLICKDGRGSQKAYLCEISNELFDAVVAHCNHFEHQHGSSVGLGIEDFKELEESSIVDQLMAVAMERTERAALLKARRGQGLFRERVRSHERACRITGVDDPALLIASHIKPWRSCATALERLDGENGLLLSPTSDFLFDRGFLTFENDGSARFSNRVDGRTLNALMQIGCHPRPLTPRQCQYMEFHRRRIFLR